MNEAADNVALPSQESRLAFLQQPGSYPERAYRVETIETHMSWVFLVNAHAYKLKKSVCYDMLDFRSAEARRYYCEEEVRLNRRLAPDVYLGVVRLTIDATGHLQLNGTGETLDWLVKMRRLPAHAMLDYAIGSGTATEQDMHRIAACLVEFYRRCVPQRIDPADYRQRLQQTIECNAQELVLPAYGLDTNLVRALCVAQSGFLARRPELFDLRVQAGKVIEGHGDLRPEHVCLEADVKIIDCLEFSRALRILDPADELGFLALECERLGAAALGEELLRCYTMLSGDQLPEMLVHFYQGCRAMLRARIAIKHLDEEKFRLSAQWRQRATGYLKLAQRHQDCINSASEPPV